MSWRLFGPTLGLVSAVSAIAAGCGSSVPASESGASSSSGTSGGFGPSGGPEGDGGGGSAAGNCTPTIVGLIRDFRAKDAPNGHPDFQSVSDGELASGLVEKVLGADKKPVFKSVGCGSHGTQLSSVISRAGAAA